MRSRCTAGGIGNGHVRRFMLLVPLANLNRAANGGIAKFTDIFQ
jgi:hypothetical protein